MPVLIPISLELDCRREDLTPKCPLLFPPIYQVPGLIPLPYRNTATIFQCHINPVWFFSFQARSEFVFILISEFVVAQKPADAKDEEYRHRVPTRLTLAEMWKDCNCQNNASAMISPLYWDDDNVDDGDDNQSWWCYWCYW